jgi:hypothetical protein
VTQDEVASARNTCPVCWQLTRVPLLQFLPSRYKEKGFRCSSCDARIQVARSTQLIAYFGGLLALGASLAAAYLLAPSLWRAGLIPRPESSAWALIVPLLILAVSAAFAAFAVPFGRLTMRLEPWVDEPR